MVVLPIKREREEEFRTNITTMANYLMLFSSQENHFDTLNNSPDRVFECKTCNRQFSSFQALGGHRASHKKPRLMGELNYHQLPTSPPKPKTHECSICGLEFPIGQALGGHMRRHRAILNENNIQVPHHVVKKSNNSRRVLCLDLNLTPLENDLEFKLGKSAPVVDCFL
ncbi:zinc finger protein ZAT11-like [Nicotiana tabacum]|uniref:Zinc finger protein ZAT11-like n=2 Tax=Nicotiana TaxID=4085 RepID=A0A1S4CEH2_TOBAC|nr:PREDICTED: zinc finger protein ZAT11-like [Nicotiana sylvestris]XP_016499555.1 PREDICTED: zinc finger protein ZAT11-like [Nicotiana tabacum]